MLDNELVELGWIVTKELLYAGYPQTVQLLRQELHSTIVGALQISHCTAQTIEAFRYCRYDTLLRLELLKGFLELLH